MHPVPRILLLALGLALAPGPGAVAQEEDEINVCRDANGEIIALQVDPCPELPAPKPAPRVKAPAKPRPLKAKPKPTVQRQTDWHRVPRLPHRASAPRPRLGKQSFPTSVTGADSSADPGFSTPERTWRSFLAASATGDPGAAAACFTPTAIARLAPDRQSFPLDDLRRTVASFTRIESEGPTGPFWSVYGVRAGQRPKWILFEETATGVWKIAGM